MVIDSGDIAIAFAVLNDMAEIPAISSTATGTNWYLDQQAANAVELDARINRIISPNGRHGLSLDVLNRWFPVPTA